MSGITHSILDQQDVDFDTWERTHKNPQSNLLYRVSTRKVGPCEKVSFFKSRMWSSIQQPLEVGHTCSHQQCHTLNYLRHSHRVLLFWRCFEQRRFCIQQTSNEGFIGRKVNRGVFSLIDGRGLFARFFFPITPKKTQKQSVRAVENKDFLGKHWHNTAWESILTEMPRFVETTVSVPLMNFFWYTCIRWASQVV